MALPIGDRGGEQHVRIPADGAVLDGDLALAAAARGVVVFAHGSGSSRFSPRNRQVAARLQAGGLGTLLMDLLTPEEERIDAATRELRFDIPLLARRLVAAVDWLTQLPETAMLPIGTFGASTGAAAALIAAAERPEIVRAVVSRGGRPDLAGDALARVHAPTLLIVGELDTTVLELNRQALERLPGTKALEIVPGATHLFEEPGALEQVARLAGEWFEVHLAGPARETRHDTTASP
ncbi:MAG: dienelactone hydrolase family protein [bacterium]|jgi:putative phosphoribosyl transferase|nr:MAG: hydrolase [bacterium]